MSLKQLILVPADPLRRTPSPSRLAAICADVGLIQRVKAKRHLQNLKPGAEFTRLISFETSHRVVVVAAVKKRLVELAEGDSRWMCTIEIPAATDEVRVHASSITEVPSCPTCKHEVSNWPEVVSAWFDAQATYRWTCGSCRGRWRPWELDWHHTNGFGRVMIAIEGIHPGEARPSPKLLDALARHTRQSWTYFFLWL